MGFDQRQQVFQFRKIELAVAVGEEDQVFRAGRDSRLKGSAVSPVDRMVDDANLRIGGREAVGDGAGCVAAAVVDHDDFVIACDVLQNGQRPRHNLLDDGGFIMAWEKHADRTGPAGRYPDGCRFATILAGRYHLASRDKLLGSPSVALKKSWYRFARAGSVVWKDAIRPLAAMRAATSRLQNPPCLAYSFC